MRTQERKARSREYQWKFRENVYTDDEWKTIALLHPAEQPGIGNWFREQLAEYELQLEQLFWKHIDTDLTDRQKEICILLKMAILQNEVIAERVPELATQQDGAQEWIAKKLNVLQCTINTAIRGGFFYEGGVAKRWGGIAQRLSKLIHNDPEMQNIIQTMSDLGADECSLRLPHWRCFRKL